MTIITARPWFAIEPGAIVLDQHGAECTVIARPTAELALLAPGGHYAPNVVSVDPSAYAPVIEPDETDALVTLFCAFPGASIIELETS